MACRQLHQSVQQLVMWSKSAVALLQSTTSLPSCSKLDFEDAKFSLYFLGFHPVADIPEDPKDRVCCSFPACMTPCAGRCSLQFRHACPGGGRCSCIRAERSPVRLHYAVCRFESAYDGHALACVQVEWMFKQPASEHLPACCRCSVMASGDVGVSALLSSKAHLPFCYSLTLPPWHCRSSGADAQPRLGE